MATGLASYFVFFFFALFVDFLAIWSAKDRGSDAGRLPPPVRVNPEEARGLRPGL